VATGIAASMTDATSSFDSYSNIQSLPQSALLNLSDAVSASVVMVFFESVSASDPSRASATNAVSDAVGTGDSQSASISKALVDYIAQNDVTAASVNVTISDAIDSGSDRQDIGIAITEVISTTQDNWSFGMTLEYVESIAITETLMPVRYNVTMVSPKVRDIITITASIH